jgi:hypothetical protein
VQPAAHSADVVQALRPVREAAAVLSVPPAEAEVPWPEQARLRAALWALPREAVVAHGESRPGVEAVPWAQPQAEAVPSVQRLAAEEGAQPWARPEEVAAVQPWAERAAAEEPREVPQAAAEARRVEVLAAAAVQPLAVPVVEPAQLSEAPAGRLLAEPSVRSDRLAQAQLARRRMTTAFRHEPARAQTERLRSQSSSAG